MSKQKAVVSVDDTGNRITYPSIHDAAKKIDGEPTHICRAIRKNIYHKGLRWRYVDNGKKIPAVLLLDIETCPMLLYAWTLFKPRVSYENIVQDWCILSWAAKWLHRPEVFSDVISPKEVATRNDKRICESLFKMMEQAEIIIAHNGKRFDIRKINSRFLIHSIRQPSPYQVIDTLTESRRNFAHSSHRLDYIGQIICRKEKLYTDFKLWVKCVNGDQEALNYMDTYCRQDILLLEDVYMQMRGWIKSHPNLNLYGETTEPHCHICLSEDITNCGEYFTSASVFDSVRCNKCGAIGRMRKSKLTPRQRERLILPTPR